MKLQYLICGRKRAGLLPIIEETSTNIYFPSPFTDTTNYTSDIDTTTLNTTTNTDNDQDETQPAIYITGDPNHVSRVKDMLNKLAVQKVSQFHSFNLNFYPDVFFFFFFFSSFLTGKVNVSQRYCTLCKKDRLAFITSSR